MTTTLIAAFALACAGNDDSALDTSAGRLESAFGTLGGTMNDREIVGALTTANASEIAVSEIALDSASSASSADVRSFARMMVTDHRAMNERVHALANALNLTTTVGGRGEDLAESGGDAADELRGKTGQEFDRAYMDAMISTHEETLEALERAARSTDTPQLDQALTEARAKVQQHLERARQLRNTVDRQDTTASRPR